MTLDPNQNDPNRSPRFLADLVTHLLAFPTVLRGDRSVLTTPGEGEEYVEKCFAFARGEAERIGNRVLGNRQVRDMSDLDMLRVIELACRRTLKKIDPNLYKDLPE